MTVPSVFLMNAKQNKILTYIPNLVISLSPELAPWRMSSSYSCVCMHVHQCACIYVCHLPTLSQAVSLLLGDKSLPRMEAGGETSGTIPSNSETDADPVSPCVLVWQVRSGVISVHFHNHFNRNTVMV